MSTAIIPLPDRFIVEFFDNEGSLIDFATWPSANDFHMWLENDPHVYVTTYFEQPVKGVSASCRLL